MSAVAASILGTGLIQIYIRHLGHDQSWGLYMASAILNGTKLYSPQLLEVNPPLIAWVSCVPVLLGRLFTFGPINGFKLFFDCVVLLSLVWTTWLTRRLFNLSNFSLWLFVALQSLADTWLIRKDSIGQREHFLFLLLLPYLVLAAARFRKQSLNLWVCTSIGVAAGLAVCLKPQHIVQVIAIEAFLLIRLKSPRSFFNPSTLALAASVAAYVILVEVFTPAYFSTMVPLLKEVYGGFDKSYTQILQASLPVAFGYAVSCALLFLIRRQNTLIALGLILNVAALAALAAYLQQHKGWPYQAIPALLLSVLCIGVLLIGRLESWIDSASLSESTRLMPSIIVGTIFLLGSALVCLAASKPIDFFWQKSREIAGILRDYPAGTPVLYLGTQPDQFPTLVEEKQIMASRFYHLWMMPAIIRRAQDQRNLSQGQKHELERLSDLQRNEIAEDLARWNPPIIIVDQRDSQIYDGLLKLNCATLTAWLSQNANFRNQFEHYKKSRSIGNLDIYVRSNSISLPAN